MQTAYNMYQEEAILGTLVDESSPRDVVSGILQGTAVVGSAVGKVIGKEGQFQSVSATVKMSGVVLRSLTFVDESDRDTTVGNNKVIPVIRKGKVWVHMETAFNPDTDTLHVRITDGGAGKGVGQFRNDVDGGDAVPVTGNVVVLSHMTGAGLCKLELNKPA